MFNRDLRLTLILINLKYKMLVKKSINSIFNKNKLFPKDWMVEIFLDHITEDLWNVQLS